MKCVVLLVVLCRWVCLVCGLVPVRQQVCRTDYPKGFVMSAWDQASLVADLTFVKRASAFSARRGVMPALRTVTVSAADGVGVLTRFDFETAVTARGEVFGDLAAVSVDLPAFLAAVKAAGAGRLTVDVVDERVVVRGSDGVASVPVFPADEIPVAPAIDVAGSAVFSADSLAVGVSAVAVAAGTDDTLPMLTGVRVEPESGGTAVSLAATDRFRLAHAELAAAVDEGFRPCLIPAKPLAAFAARMGKTGGIVTVDVAQDEQWARLSGESGDIVVRLIDADFPRWRQLLPDGVRRRLRVDAADLGRRLRKAKGQRVARVTIAEDVASVEIGSIDAVSEGQAVVSFTMPVHEVEDPAGAGCAVGISAGYNVDYLASRATSVRITCPDPGTRSDR